MVPAAVIHRDKGDARLDESPGEQAALAETAPAILLADRLLFAMNVERLLRVGTVDFDTAGTDDSEFRFVGVSDPNRIAAVVDEAQRQAEGAT